MATRQKPKAIAVIETKSVALRTLSMYHKNPRIGNIDAIAASLEENGQFKPIVVNVGSHTGRKNEILAGNHTYLGMKKNGEKMIYASFVDVDEDHATKIVLADNKTADLGSYDSKIIADLFESLPDIAGTGYSQQDYEDIMAGVTADVEAASSNEYAADVDDLIGGVDLSNEQATTEDEMSDRDRYKAEREIAAEDDGEDAERSTRVPSTDDEEDLTTGDEPVDKMAELQVVLEIKEGNVWKGNNKWGIPEIPEHAILDRFPDDITCWIGHQHTEDRPGRHFLYNYSLGGTKNLDLSRTLLAFNTYDSKFISWWDTPSYNLARMMVRGLKMAVVPDFSYYYTECRVHHLWGVYRANWIGRFFAEAGLKVVPRIQWDFRDPDFKETALAGVPLNTPTLECSIQNTNEEADRKRAAKQLRELLEHVKPEQFMVYGGNPAMRMVKESGWKGEVIHVLSYANARREAGVYDRKEGIQSLTAKQKKELREKYGAKDVEVREDGEEVPEDDDLYDME